MVNCRGFVCPGRLTIKTDCPKCLSVNARYVKTEYDIAIHCSCGFYRVVVSRLKEATILNNEEIVRLPKRDSYLWFTLVCLVCLDKASSAEITQRLKDLGMLFTISDVSSYLTILRSKKLVEPVIIRRGQAGGSTWVVQESARVLLGV